MDQDNVRPATVSPQYSTLAYMRAAKRWLVYTTDKQPFYIDGTPRRGALDTAEDIARLGTFDEACRVVRDSGGQFIGVGFALGPDEYGGHWQGIDLDEIPGGQLDQWINALSGYVEVSPSGRGLHAIGYGRPFESLGSNGSGFEAYSSGRFFTVTGAIRKDDPLTCLADMVLTKVAPLHSRPAEAARAEISAGATYVDPKTVTELRSALNSIPADLYQTWISMGQALAELGNAGRELWLTWSQTSDKWKPEDAKRWDSFKGDRTGYQAIFAKAQAAGWINPASKAAQIETPAQGSFAFKYAYPGGTILQIDYLIDPWLPRAAVIGCYGRGEAGKSSWAAQICAVASNQVSTLWISSEERQDHILQRHLSCGGEVGTLAVIEALPTKIDPVTKKPVTTNFNVYEHMEPAIVAFQSNSGTRQDRPLGVIVLDAVVALVTWGKGENANDDAGVKRLIAFLFSLSERYGVTFLILGHLNKRTSHEYIADAVTGTAAWTNSVRLAYMFVKDMESETYEGFIRTVKSNTGTHFGATYRTVPVYTLRQRPDGKNDVLCGAVIFGPIVWGELALREMMADEDDRWLNKMEQKREKVQAIVDCTLQVLSTNHQTTRKAVEVYVGDKVSRRHWQAADALLAKHGVQMQNDAHNQRVYWLTKQN